jgi:hypothetical protein
MKLRLHHKEKETIKFNFDGVGWNNNTSLGKGSLEYVVETNRPHQSLISLNPLSVVGSMKGQITIKLMRRRNQEH